MRMFSSARCFRQSILLDQHPTGIPSPAPFTYWFMFRSKQSSVMVQVTSSPATSPTPPSSLHTLGWVQKDEATRGQETWGWLVKVNILPLKIPSPPWLCRDGEHQFIIIRPPLHPARKATAAIPPGMSTSEAHCQKCYTDFCRILMFSSQYPPGKSKMTCRSLSISCQHSRYLSTQFVSSSKKMISGLFDESNFPCGLALIIL